MNWLASIFHSITTYATWMANFATTGWAFFCKLAAVRFIKQTFFILIIFGIFYGVYRIQCLVMAPLRDFIINHQSLSLGRGEFFDLAEIVTNFVKALNYVFPLDELFQYCVYLAGVYLATLAALAVYRFIKGLFGGWV